MKRRLHILSLVAILLALCFGSCGDVGHPTLGRGDEKAFHAALRRAEALMDTDPHAARVVLDSLQIVNRTPSFARLNTSKNKQGVKKSSNSKSLADYAWLRTQIEYKCDVPLTSDSLARIATDYYGTPRRPDYHAAMAWYTLGCAYGDMNDDVNATNAFLNAKSLFPDTLIRYYALTETNLGIHYLNRYMTREAEHEFQSSKQNLIRLGDSTAVAFLDLSLARCCLYREDYASAKEWLESVFRNPYASDFVFTVAHFEMAKVETYYIHDYAKAFEYIDYNIRHTTNKKELAGTYCLKAVTFQYQNQLDSAWYYYHLSLGCRSNYSTFAHNYRQMAELAPQLYKADSIAYYVRGYHTYIDSLYIISNQQAIRQVENDHRVELEQRRLEEQHRRLLSMLSLAASALAIVVLAVVVWSLSTSNRKKKQYIEVTDQLKQARMQEERQKTELAAAREEAEKLKTAYQDARSRVEELEKQHEKEGAYSEGADTALTERAHVLSDYEGRIRICADQFRQGLSWTFVQKYLHGSEHSLRKEERVTVRHDLNVCFTDYYEILQAEGKKVNQTEKTVSACYILGLKSEESGEMLGISDATIRQEKYRLKDKIPADLYNLIFSFRL